jgi:hypothetical protein
MPDQPSIESPASARRISHPARWIILGIVLFIATAIYFDAGPRLPRSSITLQFRFGSIDGPPVSADLADDRSHETVTRGGFLGPVDLRSDQAGALRAPLSAFGESRRVFARLLDWPVRSDAFALGSREPRDDRVVVVRPEGLAWDLLRRSPSGGPGDGTLYVKARLIDTDVLQFEDLPPGRWGCSFSERIRPGAGRGGSYVEVDVPEVGDPAEIRVGER